MVVPERGQAGAERHTDHRVDDDGDRVETRVVCVTDHEPDDESDRRAAAEGDRPTSGGVVGPGERETQRTERGCAGERSDDPREEPGSGSERDPVAVQRDADEGADDAEHDDVERQPALPHEVEQEVGADPDSRAGGDRDEHRHDRRADLGFDEGPVDQTEHDDESRRDAQVLLAAA